IDLLLREVDADELASRQVERHWYDVPAAGAPELEDAACRHVRWHQGEDPGDTGETIRMGLRKGETRVRNLVVGRGVHQQAIRSCSLRTRPFASLRARA